MHFPRNFSQYYVYFPVFVYGGNFFLSNQDPGEISTTCWLFRDLLLEINDATKKCSVCVCVQRIPKKKRVQYQCVVWQSPIFINTPFFILLAVSVILSITLLLWSLCTHTLSITNNVTISFVSRILATHYHHYRMAITLALSSGYTIRRPVASDWIRKWSPKWWLFALPCTWNRARQKFWRGEGGGCASWARNNHHHHHHPDMIVVLLAGKFVPFFPSSLTKKTSFHLSFPWVAKWNQYIDCHPLISARNPLCFAARAQPSWGGLSTLGWFCFQFRILFSDFRF